MYAGFPEFFPDHIQNYSVAYFTYNDSLDLPKPVTIELRSKNVTFIIIMQPQKTWMIYATVVHNTASRKLGSGWIAQPAAAERGEGMGR